MDDMTIFVLITKIDAAQRLLAAVHGPTRHLLTSWPTVALGGYCCKSPFASLIRKFLGRRRVFRVRVWGVT